MESLNPFTANTEESYINEKDLTDNESDIIKLFSEQIMDGLSLSALGAITGDEIFGDQIDKDDDSLHLVAMMDETQPLQSELIAKICAMLDSHGLIEPDRFSYQMFKRKAGYTAKSNTDLHDICKYCLAICLKDYQIVKFAGDEFLLNSEMMTPIFEILPHQGKKYSDRPSVPMNRTQIKLKNGKATIKTNHYLSVLVWVFWDGNPSKVDKKEMDTTQLQESLDKIDSSLFNTGATDKSYDKGELIYTK
jgi:hypothetical protein